MPDIVGIGMVNLDYIVDVNQLRALNPREAELRLERFEYGTEIRASEGDIGHALRQLSSLEPKISPGGSALNMVTAARSTSAPISVGYVGVCGSVPGNKFDFINWFSILGIDTSCLAESERAAGACVCYTHDGERSMLTYSGANDECEDFLQARYDEILQYLSGSRIVHVAAFSDTRSPSVLASLLRDLKQRCPAVIVSCDPGALWAPADRPRSVNDILRASDIVFVNSHEFDLLARRVPKMSDLDAAGSCLRWLSNLQALLVLKRYDRIKLFYRLGVDIVERIFQNPLVLDLETVVDDTGAGDAFAAGVLCSLCLPGLEWSDGIELGLRMARRKLQFIGMTGASEFQQDFLAFTSEIVARSRAVEVEPHQKRVFIGHGHDAQWRHVKDCLIEWDLRPAYYESSPATGKFVSEILAEQALGADFAVIVVTGEDIDSSGHVRGRQNVVHEIGLMQGRLGWGKVAILLEEGVEPFTNIAGLQYIPFSKGRVHQGLHELQEVLVREGLLQPPAASHRRW